MGLVVQLQGKRDPALMGLRGSVYENTCQGNCTDVIIRVDSYPNIPQVFFFFLKRSTD